MQVGAVRAGSVVVSTTIRGLPNLEAAHAVVQHAKRTHTLSKALQRAGLGHVKVSRTQVIEEAEAGEEATPEKELNEHSATGHEHSNNLDACPLDEPQAAVNIRHQTLPHESSSPPLYHLSPEGHLPASYSPDDHTDSGEANQSKDRLLAAQKASALVAARRASKEARALVALDAQMAAAAGGVAAVEVAANTAAASSQTEVAASSPVEAAKIGVLIAPTGDEQNIRETLATTAHSNGGNAAAPTTIAPTVMATAASGSQTVSAETKTRDMREAVFAFAATEVWHVGLAAGDSVEVRLLRNATCTLTWNC